MIKPSKYLLSGGLHVYVTSLLGFIIINFFGVALGCVPISIEFMAISSLATMIASHRDKEIKE